MSGKSTLLAALATAVIATGVVVLPATGHDVKPSGTLAFTGKGSSRDQKTVDVRPKGISLGDHFRTSCRNRGSCHRPGSGGQSPPRASIASAIAAWGE